MARQVYHSLNSANLIGLALAALLAASLPAGAAEAPPVAGLDLSAETIEYAPETITASGQVDLKLEGLEAQGEELRANLGTHMVLMPGPVTLTTSFGVVTGESLAYSWDERRGSLAKVDTTAQGIRLTGREAEISEDALVLKGGLFTKCLLPTPEYAFLARKVEVDSEKDIVKASGVTLALWGHRVLPLPNLRFSLKDTPVGRMSRERLPIPTTGFDSTRGFYVADEVPFHLSDEAIGLVGVGYGTKEGRRVTVSGLYTPSEVANLSLDAVYVEHRPGTGGAASAKQPPDLDGAFRLSARTPAGEVSFAVEDRNDPDENNQDISYLPRLDWSAPALKLAGITLSPSLQWAYVREEASGERTSRSMGNIAWAVPSTHLAGGFSMNLSGAFSVAQYGEGQSLTTNALLATLSRQVTRNLSAFTKWDWSQCSGNTPFRFDAPERLSETEMGVAWRSGPASVSASVVHDLTKRDSEVIAPEALKGAITLDSGVWAVSSSLRYEIPLPSRYSELTLSLTRRLHCFDVTLSADPVEKRWSITISVQ